MSYEAALGKLDLQDLMRAKDQIAGLIEAKQDEQKCVVWCVEDQHMVLDYFGDYLHAVDRLHREALSLAAAPGATLNCKELRLHYKLVPASEYHDYVSR